MRKVPSPMRARRGTATVPHCGRARTPILPRATSLKPADYSAALALGGNAGKLYRNRGIANYYAGKPEDAGVRFRKVEQYSSRVVFAGKFGPASWRALR